MKKTLLSIVGAIALFLAPQISFGQAINLGTASNFVLFTSSGAITNSGTGFLTHLTGDVGSNSGSSTGFGNIDGNMHDGDVASNAAAADLLVAYGQLSSTIPTAFPSSALGNGTTLSPGVYSIPSLATLSGDLTLNANGDPNAVFIFQISGSLSVAANAKMKMSNGGLACNVFIVTEGLVSVAAGSSLKGNIIAHNAAISMGTQDTLEGRALVLNGAVTMNSLVAYTPLGCGSATLTGPVAPTFGAVGIYALFSSIGPVTNSGAITYVTGDVGTNLGLTTGYNPLYVNGTIHPVPDGSTAAAAPALASAYMQLNVLPADIQLLFPAQFGNSLVITPHTYLLNAATALTDTVFLNAEGNSNAVFVIQINGALSTSPGAVVKLINGAQSQNVYWKVEGAVNLSNNVTFYGTIVANNGAIDLTSGAKFYGRALTTNGAITTSGDSINAGQIPIAGPITGSPTVCVGSFTTLAGFTAGGTFSSNSANISITAAGVVTGVTAGTATVTYITTSIFGNDTATKTITVNALPDAGTINGPSSVCTGASILLTDLAPGGTWDTYNGTASVVGGLVTGVTAGIDTISYTVTNTCGTDVALKQVTVNPIPNVNTVPDQTVCNGTATNAVLYTGSVSATTYTWANDNTTIGLAATGTGNIPAFTATNGTNIPDVATITVTPSANGCTGTPVDFTITVNPTPNVAPVADQTNCNGTATTAVVFTGNVPGTTYSWANSNTAIGLGAANTGNIPSFAATNSTNASIAGTITVTPSANSCTGAPTSFTITVNPTPDVVPVADQAVCNGATTTPVTYTGSVTGTTYNWTNTNATIGLGNNGTGNIPAFTATNNTGAPQAGTITVTPAVNGCTGNATSFTITVNPTPDVAPIADQTVCNGTSTAAANFTGTTSGATYNWTNSNTAIGLGGTGTGNIPAFTATNNGNTPAAATITVTPSANSCTGAAQSFTITVNPTPNVTSVPDQAVSNVATTAPVNYIGTVSNTTYSWTNDNATIGLANAGTGNIAPFTATNGGTTASVATITVTPSANGCTGTATSFTITVNPTPTVASVPNQTVCNGTSTTATTFIGSVSGATYSWTNTNTSIGLPASGTGNVPAFTAANTTNAPDAGTITVTPSANGCAGPMQSFTITVNPTPNVAPVANQTVCNGAATNAVNYTGTVSNTTYSWTNNDPSIGLTGNGTGDIASFTAANNTSSVKTATITVTPAANSCTGTPASFTITVNPTPDVAPMANQTACNGTAIILSGFTGSVTGTTYSWTNSNTAIGLGGSGSGTIPIFIATNSTNTPSTGTITVTPAANGCTGPAQSFTITVNPTPAITAIADQTVCNGTATATVNFTGTVNGTTYNWSNTNTGIGLGSTGTGNIASFTATNSTTTASVATITVTPSANGCPGTATSFTITVNPTPNVDAVTSQTVCNGLMTAAINYTGNVTGTTYTWTNNNTSIGLGNAGTGNIPAFTATATGTATATIVVTPSANGCTGTPVSFTITVNASPATPVISLTTPASVCDSTYFRNFGAATLPPAGISYEWSTINAAVSDTGNTQQYALINFKHTGTATVVLTARDMGTNCLSAATYDVNVSNNVADVPAQINYFNNSFVCLQNNEEAYAWGYDDAHTLAPTTIVGELNQDYVIANPDTVNRNYWAMVTHNGCIQKTYYNKPVNAQMKLGQTTVTVFPNPAMQLIGVAIKTITPGDIRMEIVNMQGQKLYSAMVLNNTATVDVSAYAAGVYLVVCYRNNTQVSFTRFMKN